MFSKTYKFYRALKNVVIKSPKKAFYLGIITLPTIYVFSSVEDIFYNWLPKSMKRIIVYKALKERFSFSGKFEDSKGLYRGEDTTICEIYPENIFDIETVLQIAQYYKVKIVTQSNNKFDIAFNHVKLNFERYNLFQVNNQKQEVKVSQGMQLESFLERLLKEGYYPAGFESFFTWSSDNHNESPLLNMQKLCELRNLTISDIIHNSYNCFIEGQFVDSWIKEAIVVTPNAQIMRLSEKSSIYYHGFSLVRLFLRSNQILGLTPEITFPIKKAVSLSIVKEKQHNLIFQSNNFENLNGDSVPYRNLKILLQNEEDFKFFDEKLNKRIRLLEKQSELNDKVLMSYKWNSQTGVMDLQLMFNQSFSYIDSCNNLIDYIETIADKLGTFALIDRPVIGLSEYKYRIQRTLGVNPYSLNEELKKQFDPFYILNPHLSLVKPSGIKLLKRNNKMFNYIVNKLELH